MLRKLGLGLLFCLSLTMGFAAVAQDANKYAEIDKHALSTPPSKERDMRNLVRYLIKPAKTDEMKARAIFRWITDRIAYDFKGVEDKDGIKKAEDAFNERKANCEGYSRLFAEMADIAGLDAKVVLGKTSDYFDASRRERVGHAWNVVKLGREWELLDVTWAAGFRVQRNRFGDIVDVKKGSKPKGNFDNSWWLVKPEQMILTHLPNNKKYQLLERPVSIRNFKKDEITPEWLRVDKKSLR